MNSFFDENYQTPPALKKRLSRRNFLKSAAMATAASTISLAPLAQNHPQNGLNFNPSSDLKLEPWKTLNSVLEHLLPSSETGPGAKEIDAIGYLFNVINNQPTEKDEIEFIQNGVNWLNTYTQKKLQQDFYQLSLTQKENALREISQSRAGENWLSTLLTYIFEALLSPPVYGGNPKGIGWNWLKHQAGFPLPTKGKRYYELGAYAKINIKQINSNLHASGQYSVSIKSVKKAT